MLSWRPIIISLWDSTTILVEGVYCVTYASRGGGRASEGSVAAGVEPDAAPRSPRGDRAVRSRAEDTLGRVPFADALARQVAGAKPAEEVVFGLVGPYGSGKTSLLNMLAEALEDDHV